MNMYIKEIHAHMHTYTHSHIHVRARDCVRVCVSVCVCKRQEYENVFPSLKLYKKNKYLISFIRLKNYSFFEFLFCNRTY